VKRPTHTPGNEPRSDDLRECFNGESFGFNREAYDSTAERRLQIHEMLDVQREALYSNSVIRSFGSKETEELFQYRRSKRFGAFERVALRKLLQIHAVTELEVLASPPGNHLEALKGERKGQHSIRINDQWRICFVWRDGHAHEVEIVDYH